VGLYKRKVRDNLIVPPLINNNNSLSLSCSLVATTREVRPELLQKESIGDAEPIPEQIPVNFFEKLVPFIPGIGQPIAATFFTLTHIDPTNW